jgi:hypothetical protein
VELYAAACVVLEDAVAHGHVADMLVAPVRLEVYAGGWRSAGRVLERASIDQKAVDGYYAYPLAAVVDACDIAQHEVPARPVPLAEIDSVATSLGNRQTFNSHVPASIEIKYMAVIGLDAWWLLVVSLAHAQDCPTGQHDVGTIYEAEKMVAAGEERTFLGDKFHTIIENDALVRCPLERSRDPCRLHLVDYDLACIGV